MKSSNTKQPTKTTQKTKSLKSQAARKRKESSGQRKLPNPKAHQQAREKYVKYKFKYDARVYAEPEDVVADRDYVKAVLGCHDYQELPSGQVGHVGKDHFWFRPMGDTAWYKFQGRLESRVYPGTFISGAWCLMMDERSERVFVTTFFPDPSRVEAIRAGLGIGDIEWPESDDADAK